MTAQTFNQDTTRTPAERRESIETIARQNGVEPHRLSAAVIYTLGQLEFAKRIAISEGCGSGELPDRLRARVEEREAELRRLIAEQPASQDDDSDEGRSFVDGVCYGIKYSVEEFQDAAKSGKPASEVEADLLRQADKVERHQAAQGDDVSTPAAPTGWRRQALARLQGHERDLQHMTTRALARELHRGLWDCYENLAADEADPEFIVSFRPTDKGLRSLVAQQRLLEEFAFPEGDSDGMVHDPDIHDLLALLSVGRVPPGVWIVQRVAPRASQEALDAAHDELREAMEIGSDARAWVAVQEALDRAYGALRSPESGSAADFQAGRHPIQQSRFWRINHGAAEDPRWWAYVGYNLQTVYARGTAEQADAYQDRLNAGRDVNHYDLRPVSREAAQQLELIDRSDSVNLVEHPG